MVTIGEGQFTYEVLEGWGRLPAGYAFREVAAVGCYAEDNVYAFNRGAHPMIVFDKDGNFIKSWGEGVFPRAHGVTMSPDGMIFCTDDGDHTVRKCTLDGEVALTLGTSGHPAGFMSGEPFNRCTHVAIDPRNGDFYVSDGYGNARIHKYSRRAAAVLVGRVRHRAGAVQHRPQHRGGQRRAHLSGRPGEPPGAGV